jgi:hypothetical protein
MDEQQLAPPAEPVEKRPTLLTVLCILTFIGSGLNAFSSLMGFLFFDSMMKAGQEVIKILKLPGLEFLDLLTRGYFAVSGLIYLLAVAGAVRMWQMRKQGFHIYTISQILGVISPMYFFRMGGPDLFSMLLSGIFILLYSTNFKKMS